MTSLHLAFLSARVDLSKWPVSGMLILHHCFSACLADAFHSFLSKAASSFPISIPLMSDHSPFPCALPRMHLLSSFLLMLKVLVGGIDCVPLPSIK